MALAGRAREILDGLPRGWVVAQIDVTLEDRAEMDRAALILSPAAPGRADGRFSIRVRSGHEAVGASPEVLRRILSALDNERIRARLTLASYELGDENGQAETAPAERPALARAWDSLIAELPADWSDLYVELRLDSTDFLERSALLLAPVNPALLGEPTGFRFRCARRFGYGVAQPMARRCLERLDGEGITGELQVLRVLSDTEPVATQGPVFRLEGRSV